MIFGQGAIRSECQVVPAPRAGCASVNGMTRANGFPRSRKSRLRPDWSRTRGGADPGHRQHRRPHRAPRARPSTTLAPQMDSLGRGRQNRSSAVPDAPVGLGANHEQWLDRTPGRSQGRPSISHRPGPIHRRPRRPRCGTGGDGAFAASACANPRRRHLGSPRDGRSARRIHQPGRRGNDRADTHPGSNPAVRAGEPRRLADAPIPASRCLRQPARGMRASRSRWSSPRPKRKRSMRPRRSPSSTNRCRRWSPTHRHAIRTRRCGPDIPGNVTLDREQGDREATDAAFAAAAHVVEVTVANNRVTPVFLEPRSAIASHDAGNDTWTLTLGCQTAHGMRGSSCRHARRRARAAAGHRAGHGRRLRGTGDALPRVRPASRGCPTHGKDSTLDRDPRRELSLRCAVRAITCCTALSPSTRRDGSPRCVRSSSGATAHTSPRGASRR